MLQMTMMQTIAHRPRPSNPSRAGFTLLELLVVMMLIAFVVGATVRLVGSDAQTDVEAATTRAAGMFRGAKSVAETRKVLTRVIVNGDLTDAERGLRQIVTVLRDGAQWKVYDELYLPRGIHFDPELSQYPTGNPHWNLSIDQNGIVQTNGTTAPWKVYQFERNGSISSPQLRVVLSQSLLDTAGQTLNRPRDEVVGGFVVFRKGHIKHFEAPSQIHGGT